MRIKFPKVLTVSILAIASSVSIAHAWTPPTVAPTGGNIAAPLNSSATAQTKTGGLITGSFDSFQIKANHIPSFTVYQYTYDGNYPGATGAKTPLCYCATSASAIDCSTTTPLGELSDIGAACYDVFSAVGTTYSLKYNRDSTQAVMAGGSGSFDNSLTIGTVLSPGHIPSLNFITDATSGSFKIANDAGTLKFLNDLASPRLIIGQDGLLTVDLSGNTGVAGRNAIQINASSDNSYGTILVNKTDLSFWNSLGSTRAGIFAKNGDFDGTLGVTGATTLTGLMTANGGITTSGSVGIGVAAPSTGVKLDVQGGNVKMEAGLDVGGVLSSKGDIEVGDKISLSQNTSSITLRPAGAGVSIYTDPVVYGSTAPTSDPHDGNVELMTSCSGLTAVSLKKDYGKLGGFYYYVRDVTCAVESGNYTIKNDANSLKFNNGSGTTRLTLAQDGTLTTNTLKLTTGAGAGKVLTSTGTDGSTSWQDGAVPAGTANGDTLRYDGTKWVTSTVLTNDGTDISVTGNFNSPNSKGLFAKNAAGTLEQWMWPRWSDDTMYTNFGTGGWNIRNNSKVSSMFLSNNGAVNVSPDGVASSAVLGVKGNFQAGKVGTGNYTNISSTNGLTVIKLSAAGLFNVGDSYRFVLPGDTTKVMTGDIATIAADGMTMTINDPNNQNASLSQTYDAYKDSNLFSVSNGNGTPKLTVNKTGNVSLAGTLGVTGATTFTGTVSGVTKAMVGLGSADDTADTAKPVSTAQQAALDLKAPLASPTFTGTMNGDSAIFTGSVTAGSFLYSSDLNLKKNIASLSGQLGKILQLRGVSFDWKKDGKHSTGLVAQEVEKVYPELVSTDKVSGLKSVAYGNLVAPLIEAVKEQQKQIDALKAEIENLKK